MNALEIVERAAGPAIATDEKGMILAWNRAARQLLAYKDADPEVQIIAHPECSTEVTAVADFTGSTKGMIDYALGQKAGSKVLLVTECSMASNIQEQAPGVEFIKPCNLCPHMKRITLPKILDSLLEMKEEVVVDPLMAEKARHAVERMVNLKN